MPHSDWLEPQGLQTLGIFQNFKPSINGVRNNSSVVSLSVSFILCCSRYCLQYFVFRHWPVIFSCYCGLAIWISEHLCGEDSAWRLQLLFVQTLLFYSRAVLIRDCQSLETSGSCLSSSGQFVAGL